MEKYHSQEQLAVRESTQMDRLIEQLTIKLNDLIRTTNRLEKSTLPRASPMGGMMMSLTNDAIIAPSIAPSTPSTSNITKEIQPTHLSNLDAIDQNFECCLKKLVFLTNMLSDLL